MCFVTKISAMYGYVEEPSRSSVTAYLPHTPSQKKAKALSSFLIYRLYLSTTPQAMGFQSDRRLLPSSQVSDLPDTVRTAPIACGTLGHTDCGYAGVSLYPAAALGKTGCNPGPADIHSSLALSWSWRVFCLAPRNRKVPDEMNLKLSFTIFVVK